MAEVRGLPELFAALDGLHITATSAARTAVNAGAQLVKREAILRATAQGFNPSGDMVKNIAVKRERGTSRNITEYHVGVRHGRDSKKARKIAYRTRDGKIRFEYDNDPFYWWFWEFGHYNHWLKAHVPARPFIGPAIKAKESQVLDVMREALARRLERVTMKALA